MGSPRPPDRAAAAASAEAEAPEHRRVLGAAGTDIRSRSGPIADVDASGSAVTRPHQRVSAEEDQEAADAERACRRHRKQDALQPDAIIGPLLTPGEVVVATRSVALLERRLPEGPSRSGALYITSRRVVHLGNNVVAYDLEQIREAIVAGGRLHLLLTDGVSLEIAVERPRLLRVEMALPRVARRDCSTRGH